MSSSGTPWQDAGRAWEHLARWHQNFSSPRNDLPAADDDALAVLADIGTVRRLLDNVELDAVRTARRERRSWAEIATRLGVSRQSAWERWRDLDDADEAGAPGTADTAGGVRAAPGETPSQHPAAKAILGSALEEATADATEEITGQKVKRLRRRSTTVVPNVIGRSWEEARLRLSAASLIGVAPEPDSPLLPVDAVDSGSVVESQAPEAGAKVPIGSLVRLWVGRGGGSAGVREPRRPAPSPRPVRRAPLEPADDAVG